MSIFVVLHEGMKLLSKFDSILKLQLSHFIAIETDSSVR